MICAAGLQKVALRSDGKIVQLFTKQRHFTPNQRRALYARDGGCIIPGCTIPGRRTEVHHVHEWAKGCPTDTNNGVLLCWYHHRSIDTSGWKIQMRDGVPWIKGPPWLNDALLAEQHNSTTAQIYGGKPTGLAPSWPTASNTNSTTRSTTARAS